MTFCAAVVIANTGSVSLNVCVPALHGDEYDTIAAGEDRTYRSNRASIKSVMVKTASSTTTYRVSPIMGEA